MKKYTKEQIEKNKQERLDKIKESIKINKPSGVSRNNWSISKKPEAPAVKTVPKNYVGTITKDDIKEAYKRTYPYKISSLNKSLKQFDVFKDSITKVGFSNEEIMEIIKDLDIDPEVILSSEKISDYLKMKIIYELDKLE